MSTDHQSLSLVNLLYPEVRANPYALYERIRSTDPVHWDEPLGFWALTRYADAVSALHDSRFSKAQGLSAALNRYPESVRESARPQFDAMAKQMLFADPPYHSRLRGLVSKAFTPRAIERMRAHIQQVVDGLLDVVQPYGRMDVIRQFAYPLPLIVILEMLGLPIDERERLKQWSDDLTAMLGVVQRSPETIANANQALSELTQYFNPLYEQLYRQPKDDLLSALVMVEEQGNGLSCEEVMANTFLLLIAGHETTTNLIGNGLLALLRHPEQWQLLRDNPSLIGMAVEELLRYDNPVQIVWRYATADIAMGDKPIGKGQLVNVIVGAANRDPEQFAEPDKLDLRRGLQRHLGFSLGIHFCLGAPLARLEGEIALNTLLRRMPQLALETEDLEWHTHPTFHALKSLPVVF